LSADDARTGADSLTDMLGGVDIGEGGLMELSDPDARRTRTVDHEEAA